MGKRRDHFRDPTSEKVGQLVAEDRLLLVVRVAAGVHGAAVLQAVVVDSGDLARSTRAGNPGYTKATGNSGRNVVPDHAAWMVVAVRIKTAA